MSAWIAWINRWVAWGCAEAVAHVDRWPPWTPVAFGVGAACYFGLKTEPFLWLGGAITARRSSWPGSPTAGAGAGP